MRTTTEESYLAISEEYAQAIGEARWSKNCEAIETAEGKTLALSSQIIAILKGVFSTENPPSFDYVLLIFHYLHYLSPDAPQKAWMERFRSAWSQTKSAWGRTQHFGRLISELCKDIPGPAHVPSFEKVQLTLHNRELSSRPFPSDMAEIPPLNPAAFEKRLEEILASWSQERILHWLKFGTGPTGAAESIREKVESLPDRLAAIMQMAKERQRLSGAVSLVPMLDGALTFPPRRQTPKSLNLGGFAEIATKGDLSHLLISQLALDPDEFLRRYVEGELLYFQKEKPHQKSKPERLLVLDQGIRTWGPIRLALSGAALSLLSRNLAKGQNCQIMTTSRSELLDAAARSPVEMIEALEASDFSSNPFSCLARTLKDSSRGAPPREIVLLTHSQTLKDPQLAALAKELSSNDRLFCLGVDELGDAELWEHDPITARLLVQFRIDLEGAERVKVRAKGASSAEIDRTSGWTGQVEPYGFPFGPGLICDLHTLGFSADGEWLVVAGRDRILQAIQVEDGKSEILPRAFLNGKLFHDVEEILGVKDGVVVCGTMEVTAEWVASMNAPEAADTFGQWEDKGEFLKLAQSANPGFRMHFAAHYNRFKKQVRFFPFAPFSPQSQWVVFPDLHCVVLVKNSKSIALDLAGSLDDRFSHERHASSRAHEAVKRIKEGKWQRAKIPVLGWREGSVQAAEKSATLRLIGNGVLVQNAPVVWEMFEPQQEGKPLLGGQAIEQAQLAGEVLALSLFQSAERKIVLFRAPKGNILQEYTYRSSFRGFCLSSDGTRMARRIGKTQIVIHETMGERDNLATVLGARLHSIPAAGISSDPFRLTLATSGVVHRFELVDGVLIHSLSRQPEKSAKVVQEVKEAEGRWDYDPARFQAQPFAHGSFFVRDRWGQTLLVNQKGEMVAAWIVRRTSAAVWIPGGVFWGDPTLIGRAPTPRAEVQIGQALARFLQETPP